MGFFDHTLSAHSAKDPYHPLQSPSARHPAGHRRLKQRPPAILCPCIFHKAPLHAASTCGRGRTSSPKNRATHICRDKHERKDRDQAKMQVRCWNAFFTMQNSPVKISIPYQRKRHKQNSPPIALQQIDPYGDHQHNAAHNRMQKILLTHLRDK